MEQADLIRRWQHGWGLARELAPAEPISGMDGTRALEVTLDLPGRYREFVTIDPEAVHWLVPDTVKAERPTWLSVPAADVAPALRAFADGGLRQIGTLDYLMSISLAEHPVRPVPEGYHVRSALAGSVLRVEVVDGNGEVAARGLAGLAGEDAVAHGIVTEAAHRRRGLGSVVMSTLCREATAHGATTGLLCAVPDGEKLYTALGWTKRAQFVTGAVPTSGS
ncbi:GNAT family N-acetyltransferase [Amycolatopsis taiwanensis]|nr:GNAT family N-acetyltransferase [Amycolatopsis taiwanensis]